METIKNHDETNPVLSFLGLVSLVIAISAYQGWVLVKVWDWYFIPVFHFPPVSIKWMVAMVLVLKGTFYRNQKPDPDVTLTKSLVFNFAWSTLTLGIAWILK